MEQIDMKKDLGEGTLYIADKERGKKIPFAKAWEASATITGRIKTSKPSQKQKRPRGPMY